MKKEVYPRAHNRTAKPAQLLRDVRLRLISALTKAGAGVSRNWRRLKEFKNQAAPHLHKFWTSAIILSQAVRSRLRPLAHLMGTFCLLLMVPGLGAIGYKIWCLLVGAACADITLYESLIWLLPKVISSVEILGWQADGGVLSNCMAYLQCDVPPESLLRKASLTSCLPIRFGGLILSEILRGNPPQAPTNGAKPSPE